MGDKTLRVERRRDRKLGKDMGEIIAKFSNELLVRFLRCFPEEVLLSRRQGECRSRMRISNYLLPNIFPLSTVSLATWRVSVEVHSVGHGGVLFYVQYY